MRITRVTTWIMMVMMMVMIIIVMILILTATVMSRTTLEKAVRKPILILPARRTHHQTLKIQIMIIIIMIMITVMTLKFR